MNARACSLAVSCAALVAKSFAGPCDFLSPPPVVDDPDSMWIDTNGDGIDGMACGPIFVSPLGLDSNPGTMDLPMRTPAAAVVAAALYSPPRDVYLAYGAYLSTITTRHSIRVFGGFDAFTWARTALRPSIAASSAVIVVGDGAAGQRLFSNLELYASARTGAGESAVCVVKQLLTGSLDLESCVLLAESGNPGTGGAAGTPGRDGSTGGNGGTGSAESNAGGFGGSGAFSPWGSFGGTGGRGGYDSTGSAGASGGGAPSGGGGGGGGSGGTSCTDNGNSGASGAFGFSGSQGAHGAGGAAAAAGASGNRGVSGRGGGGGGGGGGGYDGLLCNADRGGGGGGGGGGGEGGGGGAGGTSGGSSVGVLLLASDLSGGFSMDFPSWMQLSSGGQGGVGGAGARGGIGASGGNGGGAGSGSESGPGGHGGSGGGGGFGGHGGGGGGGLSVGVARVAGATSNVLGAINLGTGGAGGPAQTSSPGIGNPGSPGVASPEYLVSATVANAIRGSNYPPSAVQCRIVCSAGSTSAPTAALALDPDGDVASYALITSVVTGGTAAEASDGVFTFTADPGFSGWTSFRISATDSGGRTVTGYAVVYVQAGPAPCVADVDDGSGTGTPDGGVTIDDLIYYLAAFEAGNISTDIDDGSGTGTPDGGVTIDDLLYYLVRFEAGC